MQRRLDSVKIKMSRIACLHVYSSSARFLIAYCLRDQTTKDLARMCGCAGLSELLLFRYAVIALYPWFSSKVVYVI